MMYSKKPKKKILTTLNRDRNLEMKQIKQVFNFFNFWRNYQKQKKTTPLKEKKRKN